MKNKQKLSILLSVILLALTIPGSSYGEQIESGSVEGTGTYFEITDSEYLNVILDSSEEIQLRMESVPEMITMFFEKLSLTSVSQTKITLNGLDPLTIYHKFQDDYHNLTIFVTDANGSYTYTQDLSEVHFVFIQPRRSTKFIQDSATGGDCTSIGTWDQSTKTCTLTTDVSEAIQIDDNNIVLDGDGHTITGTNTGNGIMLSGTAGDRRSGITVKNLNVRNFSNGIFLYLSNNNTFEQINSSNNQRGVYITVYSADNTFRKNVIENNNLYGIKTYYVVYRNIIDSNIISHTATYDGIYIEGPSHTVSNNTVEFNHSGIYVDDSYNVIKNNNILNNSLYGIGIGYSYYSQNNQFYNNNIIDNLYQIVNYGRDNIFNLDLPTGGNYWSDYDTPAEGCDDTNSDGFCDAPYVFQNGQDNLPWTTQDGWDLTGISGKVTVTFNDNIFGNVHALKDVNVSLWRRGSDWVAGTTTDQQGYFKFNVPFSDLYNIRVALSGPSIEVLHDNDAVIVQTPSFSANPYSITEVNVEFSDPDLSSFHNIDINRVDDLAITYYHVKQFFDFVTQELKANLSLPIVVHAFVPDSWTSLCLPGMERWRCDESLKAWYEQENGEFYFGENISNYQNGGRPMNREWHEAFHKLMDDNMEYPDGGGLFSNHKGYENDNTQDSWVEGWAEFWPCVLWDYLELGGDPGVYYPSRSDGPKLEENHKAWEIWPSGLIWPSGQKEEWAVASLLWDLYDPIAPPGQDEEWGKFGDNISISYKRIWSILSNNEYEINDIKNLYDVLKVELGMGDSDDDGISDLDELFIAHGFFADLNGNHEYDPEDVNIGENAPYNWITIVGRTAYPGKEWRTNTPISPEANILISVEGVNGGSEDNLILVIEHHYSDPRRYLDYTIETPLPKTSNYLVHLESHPVNSPVTITYHVRNGNGTKSDTLIVPYDVYCKMLYVTTNDYAVDHTFTIGAEEQTTYLVAIDIKPGSEPNCFNSDGHGVIPVAILSSTDFDATQVNPISVTLNGQGVRVVGKGNKQVHIADANGDGVDDLVVQIEDIDGTYGQGDTMAMLTGETFDGMAIEGYDTICIVP